MTKNFFKKIVGEADLDDEGLEDVRADSVTINGGDSNDTILASEGSFVDGGAGDDFVWNISDEEPDKFDGADATIIGGDGNDYISNGSSYTFIDSGTGNDTVHLWDGLKSTINTGDDSVFSYDLQTSINAGDGNDTYSTKVSGADVIVTSGKAKITLVGATSIKALNIAGKNSNPLFVSSANRSIVNSRNGATIQPLGGRATIQNSGSNVYIDGDLGGNHVINSGNNVLIDLSDKTAHFYTSGNGSYALVNNTIVRVL